ncbi:hypothetical protein P7C70_g101, partial [Phenoliferia sp. Uapishka_3]
MVGFISSYSTPSPQPAVHGWALAVAFLLVGLVYTFSLGLWNLALNQGTTELRSFMLEAIYRKATRIHVEEVTRSVGVGKASNLMSVDTERILERIKNVYEILNATITVALGFFILYQQVGVAFVACIIAVVMITVGTPYFAVKLGPLQASWSAATDARTLLTSSVLRQIKTVKLSALETPLYHKIVAAREKELQALKQFWYQLTWVVSSTNFCSNLQSLLTIGTYAIISIVNPSAPLLTSARLFTTVAVLNLIASPLLSLGQSYGNIVAAFASIKRIEGFLLEREAPPRQTPGSNVDINFADATFGIKDELLLSNISATIRHKQRTFVIGRVGCGKSTFLNAALGEVDLISGTLILPSARTGYCSQDPWLRAESIRSAVVFLSDYDEGWYIEVLRAVALDVDLKIITGGDKALCSHLSGGQKQRVALARAIYARTERLILDDVFSALDASTSDHVFSALFDEETGLLKGRTVLIATNDLQRLQLSHHIIMLHKGKIVEQGSFTDLLAANGPTSRLVEEFASEERKVLKKTQDDSDQKPESLKSDEASEVNPMDDEGARGGIKLAAYKAYGRAVGRWTLVIYIFFVVISGSTSVVTQIYLSFWSSAMDKNARSGLVSYLGGYIGIELASLGIFIIWFLHAGTVAGLSASRGLHNNLIRGVLAASASALEGLGVGKVLNRFNSDMSLIDDDLASALLNLTGLAETIQTTPSIRALTLSRSNTAGIIGTAIAPSTSESEKSVDLVWPQQGGIIFQNVSARYGPNLPPALKSLSVKISAGSRVGICGRSGSGKSTILATLFRALEMDAGSTILVGGMDLATISKARARSAMSIVPQDPLLLDTTLRENLDISGERSDDEVWEALERCSMKAFAERLPLKLQENLHGSFSRGQKQLIALARTLLQRRSILCLDEATSSLDAETDRAIQDTLRTAFSGATIITVAHRLATIMDYDQILVMLEGSLVEFGSPADLLAIPGGFFRNLVKGEETQEGINDVEPWEIIE